MADTEISFVRKVIRWAGFNPMNGSWGVKVFIYVVVLTVLILNSLFYVVYKWNDSGKGLEGVKGLVLYLMCVTYILGLTSHWDETMLLVNTIENGLYKYPYRNTEDSIELRNKVENDMRKLRSIWNYMLVGYTLSVYLAPPVIFIFRAIQHSLSGVTVDMLHTTLPFYYPENYETITLYIIAYLLQCHLFTTGTLKGYVVLVSAFNSMQMIAGELMLLRQSLEEIDSIINIKETKEFQKDSEDYFIINMRHSKNDNSLKGYLKYFLKHHDHIHRKVKTVTRGMQLIAFSINSGMSVLLCTSLYTMARTTDVMIIMNEAMYSSVLTFCLYCYGLMGEKISTEDEKLRTALYSYRWIDKPQWFRRSLLVIMTRTTRTIEMKSSGLFTLNLRNYVLTLRAAYSYYNVISSMR